jgi:hypothetical protein
MKIDEVNDMIYYLAEKYEFNPLKYKINLLTGIVMPRGPDYVLDAEILAHDSSDEKVRLEDIGDEDFKPNEVNDDYAEDASPKIVEIEDSVDGIRTYRIYAEELRASYLGARGVEDATRQGNPEGNLGELDEWIKDKQLTYLEARKMISSLELKRKLGEISPGSAYVMDSDALNEFEGWIRRRRLNYFNVRMMIAQLGQEEEQARMEKAVAR